MDKLRLAMGAVTSELFNCSGLKRGQDNLNEDNASEPKRKKKKKNREREDEKITGETPTVVPSLEASRSAEVQESSTKKKKKRKKDKHKLADQAPITSAADVSGVSSQGDGASGPRVRAATPHPLVAASPTDIDLDDDVFTQLNNNDDILRAFQSLDLPRLAGVLRNLDLPSAGVSLNTSDSPFADLLANGGIQDDLLLENENSAAPAASVSTAAPKQKSGQLGSKKPSKPSKNPRPNPNQSSSIGSSIASETHTTLLATKWLNAARLRELKESEGLVWKEGKFSTTETQAIKTALDNYKMAHGLNQEQLVDIIFAKKQVEHSTFWSEITASVPGRPIVAVYHHVQRRYDPRTYQGKWTKDEDNLLIQGVADLGKSWKKIADRVGRTAGDCRDRWRNHLCVRDTKIWGEWSKEEEEELTKIIMEFKDKTGQGKDSDSDIYWTEVSRRMGGKRSRQQCQFKWIDSLNAENRTNGEVNRWSDMDTSILVHKVAALTVLDESEIDWKQLRDKDWNLYSGHLIQRRWRKLALGIKDHEQMSFRELADVLLHKHGDVKHPHLVPRLRKTAKQHQKSASVIKDDVEVRSADKTGQENGERV